MAEIESRGRDQEPEEESQESGVGSRESEERRQKITHKKKIELLMEIDEKDAKIEEYLSLAKTLKADFENYKKRQEEEKGQLKKIYQTEIILEFLPIFDNLERALNQESGVKSQESGVRSQESRVKSQESGDNIEKIIEGITLVKKGFEDILEKNGVTRIKTIGCEFSPRLHIAILSMPTKEQNGGIILEEIQSGWVYNDFCLRPASVVVSKKWEEEA